MSGLLRWMEDWVPQSPENWSDLHLRIGELPVIKTGGMKLMVLETAPVVTEEDLNGLLERRIDWSGPVDLDHGAGFAGVRFRINAYRSSVGGHGLVLRKLGSAPPPLESLNLPTAVLRRKTEQAQGLIIVAGETGSGKTTTLASLMADRGKRHSSTTITIEDPVEIVHPKAIAAADGGVSLYIQREVGADTVSFASGLRAALREAPDVIAVGEIRDRESAQLALQGAETGHLVFATLHTRSAAETVARLLAFFPVDEHPLVRSQLSTGLVMVMRQVLLPSKDGQGRVPAFEIMTMDGGVPATIRKAKDEQILNEIRQGGAHGMVALNDMLARLVRDNKITSADAMSHSYDTDELTKLM